MFIGFMEISLIDKKRKIKSIRSFRNDSKTASKKIIIFFLKIIFSINNEIQKKKIIKYEKIKKIKK
jgi:hypothetical protein